MGKQTKPNKNALGKGMGALLGSGAAPIGAKSAPSDIASSTGSLIVPIEKVKANKQQPRKIFIEKELQELANSIKENGIIQPLVVTQQGTEFLLISGERRLRASRLAGLEQVPVVVKKVTKKDQMAMAIIENVQRSDLNCVEEALAYYQLMNEFSLTQEEVAIKIGKERSTIANYLRILKLPREVVKMVQKDELSFGHAKVLVSMDSDEAIKRFAYEAIEQRYSVRDLEKAIKTRKSAHKAADTNKFFDESLDRLRLKLEKKTGFHFDVKSKKKGKGEVVIKFNNEAEFNDIYSYLIK